MSKLVEAKHQDGKHYAWSFHCPGCDRKHYVSPGWAWNNSMDAPTFTPSLLITYNGSGAGVNGAPSAVCHSNVTNGRIFFHGDCTHALVGQTVDLPDL